MAFFDFLKRKDFEKKEAPQIGLNTTVSNYS